MKPIIFKKSTRTSFANKISLISCINNKIFYLVFFQNFPIYNNSYNLFFNFNNYIKIQQKQLVTLKFKILLHNLTFCINYFFKINIILNFYFNNIFKYYKFINTIKYYNAHTNVLTNNKYNYKLLPIKIQANLLLLNNKFI